MEPITQGLLGATVAQAGWRHTLGRSALLYGALLGLLPDIDVIFAGLHRGFGEMLYHRGTTHSLWFGFVAGPILAWLIWRWRARREPIAHWAWLAIAALVTHPLLDAFTPYGTQLFAPFDRLRVAWQGVAIIDPLYTVLLLIAVVVGARRATDHARARRVAAIMLALSTGYLLLGVWLNDRAADQVAAELRRSGSNPSIVRVYPTFLQSFLRRVVARADDGVHIGLHTPFGDALPYWEGHFREEAPDETTRALHATWEGKLFVWFAMDDTKTTHVPTPDGSVVYIEDLRYGLPGAPPDQGLWGIMARYDETGRRVGEVERFRRQRGGRMAPVLTALWNATWGDYAGIRELGQHSLAR